MENASTEMSPVASQANKAKLGSQMESPLGRPDTPDQLPTFVNNMGKGK